MHLRWFAVADAESLTYHPGETLRVDVIIGHVLISRKASGAGSGQRIPSIWVGAQA
jgi:hypothetical protein